MNWLTKILEDKNTMRSIRISFAFAVVIVLGLLYFGWYRQLSLDAILNADVGALGLLAFISWFITWWETGEYTFSLRASKKDIVDVQDDIGIEIGNIIDDDIGIKFVKEYNKRNQERANIKLTDSKIEKLNHKIRKCKVKDKNYDDLDKQVALLQVEPVFNKHYKPIKYMDLISLSGNSGKNKLDSITIGYNPISDGWKRAIGFNIVQMFGLGINAVIPFIIDDWKGMITYFITLTLLLIRTSAKRYVKINRKTSTKYKDGLNNQLRLLKDINASKPVEKIEDNKQVESVTEPQNEDKGGYSETE